MSIEEQARAREEGVRQGRQDAIIEGLERQMQAQAQILQKMSDSLIALKIKMASIGALAGGGTVGIFELLRMWN